MKNLILAVSGVAIVAGASAFYANPAEAQQRGPRGSYAQTCPDTEVRSGRLYARCYDTRGQLRGSSIEVNRCNGHDINNSNGLLMCGNNRGRMENLTNNDRPNNERPNNGRPGWDNGPNRPGQGHHGPNRPGWDNGRGAAITVYRDAQYRGTSRTFDGSIRNLREYGLNDAISSIRLSRGTWEICEHADFRGRCETVRGDVRDLTRMNFNDKVSSLRPVGRR